MARIGIHCTGDARWLWTFSKLQPWRLRAGGGDVGEDARLRCSKRPRCSDPRAAGAGRRRLRASGRKGNAGGVSAGLSAWPPDYSYDYEVRAGMVAVENSSILGGTAANARCRPFRQASEKVWWSWGTR